MMLRKALEDAKEMDVLKLVVFRKQMLVEVYNWNLFIVDIIEQLKGPTTKPTMGPTTILTPMTVANIKNPNMKQIPSMELDFFMLVVLGSTLGLGQYFVNFSIETLTQNLSLVVDTGFDHI